jgi:hypothetical protein
VPGKNQTFSAFSTRFTIAKEIRMNAHDMNAINALDLEPIKVKLMHQESGEGWSLEYANAMEFEYRRFLFIMKTFPHEQAAPLMDVDIFWHYHILDTMKYAVDCDAVFGHFLHHFPYIGLRGEDDEAAHVRIGNRMKELYEETFGEDYIRVAANDQSAYSASPGAQAAYSASPGAVKAAYSASPASAKTAYSASPGALKAAYSASPANVKTAYSASPGAIKTAYSASPANVKSAYSASPGVTAYSASPGAIKAAYSASPGSAKSAYSASPGASAYSASPGATAYSASPGAADEAIEQARLSSFYSERPRLTPAA